MTWADLFERAAEYETDVETIREALAVRREGGGEPAGAREKAEEGRDA